MHRNTGVAKAGGALSRGAADGALGCLHGEMLRIGLDWIGWIFSEASRVPAPGGDVLLEGFGVCVEYQ